MAFTDAVRALAEDAPQSLIMVLIPAPDVAMARLARSQGFRGVLPKTSELPIVAAAMRLVLAGGVYFPCFDVEDASAAITRPVMPLSRRQAEILVELEAGATNKEIARKIGISLATVKMHVRALLNLVGAPQPDRGGDAPAPARPLSAPAAVPSCRFQEGFSPFARV